MNPYLTNYSSSGTTNVKVNNIKPNVLGNVVVPLSSLPDVDIVTESLATGELLSYNADSEKMDKYSSNTVYISF